MAKQLEKLTPRDVDFAQWYTDIVKNAQMMEYGPVKGTMIFKPYGYAIWENIQRQLDREFKRHGVQNVYFPLLIPESLFNQEKDHIAGFAPEVATVTKVGDKVLEENLFIRPTSEVLFANYYKNNLQSYRDLPIIFNQWVNVMRWEKTTRPFLRTSEFLWQEGHTIHETETEANNYALEMLKVYETFAKQHLLLPVIAGRKTAKERFAGAVETYTIESLMHDGQALQAGTSHYLGQNFSHVYNIQFQGRDGKLDQPYATSWGVSTRLIGAIIMTHGDDRGLVLPSKIAPDQIRIIPVNDNGEVLETAIDLKTMLSEKYRIAVDQSAKTFGYKMNEAEIQGVPLRIEIGPRDLANNQVTISRRDTGEKQLVGLKDVGDVIPDLLTAYDQNLYDLALANREARTYQVKTFQEYLDIINTRPGFVLVPFCGRVEDEEAIKQESATNSRCIPFEYEADEQPCFHCGQPTTLKVYFGRAY